MIIMIIIIIIVPFSVSTSLIYIISALLLLTPKRWKSIWARTTKQECSLDAIYLTAKTEYMNTKSTCYMGISNKKKGRH